MSVPESSPSAKAEAPSRGRRSRRRRSDSTNGLALAEESFHLLRTIPLPHLLLYYLGTVPFVVAAFFFWADMSRSSYAARDAAIGALTLVGMYLWMKGWQGWFCRQLWHHLHPSGRQVPMNPARVARYFAAQVPVHAFSLPAHLVALLFLGWPLAFFQNASVLAFTQDYGTKPLRGVVGDATRFAHRNWLQNYLVLLLVLVLSLFTWINMLGAAVLVPMALKTFFGIESVFTLSPESAILNTTFLFGATLLSFLLIDPFLKALYTLRCFRSQSLRTGADLISRIDRLEAEAASSRQGTPTSTGMMTKTFLAGALLALGIPSPAHADDDTTVSSPPVSPETLSESIESTLQGKEYQWRLPRQDLDVEGQNQGWLASALDDLTESIERTLKEGSESIDDFFRKLFEGERSSRSAPMPGVSSAGAGIGNVAKVLFVAIVAALLIWIVVRIVAESRRRTIRPIDEPALAGPIDLESDRIVATQLPEDEWMKLAREQIAKGQHRLAIRALFLASLAHLGDRGMLRIARFKSNRDYSRELDLKARALPEVRNAFGENVGLFERVWYGLHEIGRDAVDRFTANYESITRETPAPPVNKPPTQPPGKEEEKNA